MKQLFTKLLQQHPDFATITASVAQHRFPLNIVGLSAVHKANMAAALCNYYHRTAILLTPDEPSGRRLCEDLKVMCGEDAAAFFPMREFCFRDVDSTSHEYEHERLNLLGRAVQGSLRFAVASIEGALQYTIPPEMLNETTMILERGKNIPVQEIVSMLVQAGYVRREQVDGVSQFAVRGGILDLYPPHCPRPVRVEFWGDEIDSLNYFDLDSQRRDEDLPSLRKRCCSAVQISFAKCWNSCRKNCEENKENMHKLLWIRIWKNWTAAWSWPLWINISLFFIQSRLPYSTIFPKRFCL